MTNCRGGIMTQTALMFDRPFYPDLDYEYGSQKQRMYDRLKACCSVTNTTFVTADRVWKYTNRISEIRHDLEAHGWTIRAERLHDGLWEYHLEKGGSRG
jgi:hypothetical protein